MHGFNRLYVLLIITGSCFSVSKCQEESEEIRRYETVYSPDEADVRPFPIQDEAATDVKEYYKAGRLPRERVEAYLVRYPNHKYDDEPPKKSKKKKQPQLGSLVFEDQIIKSPQYPINGWVEVVDTPKSNTLLNSSSQLQSNFTTTETVTEKDVDLTLKKIPQLKIEEFYNNSPQNVTDKPKMKKPILVLNKDKKIRLVEKDMQSIEKAAKKTLKKVKKIPKNLEEATNTNVKPTKNKVKNDETKLNGKKISKKGKSREQRQIISEEGKPPVTESLDDKYTYNTQERKSFKKSEALITKNKDQTSAGSKKSKQSFKPKKRESTTPGQLQNDEEDLVVEATHHKAKFHEEGGGKGHKGEHHADGEANSGHGYEKHHHVDKGGKGSSEKELHRKDWEEADGKKKHYHDHAGHSGHHEEEAHGHKGAKFNEKKGHKKGHKTKGYHNKYHKDEYHKEHKFYDDFHKGGSHHRFGKFHAKHQSNENGRKKAHHFDAGHDSNHKGKKGYTHKAHTDADHKGYDNKKGHEEHHNHKEHHAKKGGKGGGSHYGYQKKQ